MEVGKEGYGRSVWYMVGSFNRRRSSPLISSFSARGFFLCGDGILPSLDAHSKLLLGFFSMRVRTPG